MVILYLAGKFEDISSIFKSYHSYDETETATFLFERQNHCLSTLSLSPPKKEGLWTKRQRTMKQQ